MKIEMPDGQSFELDDSIASNDELLREALRGAFPDAATATFDRSKANVVKVVKKAGTKGGTLAELLAAPEQLNPGIVMQQRVMAIQLGPDPSQKLLRLAGEIKTAIERGLDEVRQVERACRVLRDAEPQTGAIVPTGF